MVGIPVLLSFEKHGQIWPKLGDKTKMKKGTYKIIGSGYGHGVGMSQYGARDMADAGFDYDEIIKYYYQDVDIITIE